MSPLHVETQEMCFEPERGVYWTVSWKMCSKLQVDITTTEVIHEIQNTEHNFLFSDVAFDGQTIQIIFPTVSEPLI